MHRLSQDMVGMNIADQLQLKYWADTTFFQDMVSQEAWDQLDELPKRERQFPIEVEAKATFNLLCGRPIFQNNVYPFNENSQAWIKLDFTSLCPGGDYTYEVLPTFDVLDIKQTLSVLPISTDQQRNTLRRLLRGDLADVSINNNIKIFLRSNPEQKQIDFLCEDMRPIPVNLQFDPDWKAPTIPELNSKKEQKQLPQNVTDLDKTPNQKNWFRRRR